MNSVIKKTTTIETTYDEQGKIIEKKETIVEEETKNDNIINIPYSSPIYTTPVKINPNWITTTIHS